MSCPDCVRGSILDGNPLGTIQKVYGLDAYFVSGVSESTPKTCAVVLLTDAFGLEVVNSRLIADKIAQALCCDVWVPNMFDGPPMMDPNSMEAHLLPDHLTPWPLWDRIKFYARIVWNLPTIYRTRPSVVTPRTAEFIKILREQRKYHKLGAVGYCYGGGVAARLAPSKVLDSIVLCHPSLLSEAIIKAIDVPSSWACAAEDALFPRAARLKAEAIFAARKDKPEFVPYEFVDYKGTVHGFACRPNLAYEDIKAGFEGSLSQTVAWFEKTLATDS